jgi:hypothetical protein
MNSLQKLSDEAIVLLYDGIREHASVDIRRHRLLGQTAKQQAERLREELDRRRLKYSPIVWGQDRV